MGKESTDLRSPSPSAKRSLDEAEQPVERKLKTCEENAAEVGAASEVAAQAPPHLRHKLQFKYHHHQKKHHSAVKKKKRTKQNRKKKKKENRNRISVFFLKHHL